MSIVESALQGAMLGVVGCGIGMAIRKLIRPNDGRPANPAKVVAASAAAEEEGTIAPILLPEAGKPANDMPKASPADRSAPKDGKPATEEAIGWLVARSGAQKGRRYDLVAGEIRIGRSENCAIRIKDDTEVSREHAMIRVNPQECRLCDLGSRNGTYLNGAKVEAPRRLQEGDALRIGGTEFTFIRA